MSVFDQNVDTILVSCSIGLAVVLACLCALIAINEWILEKCSSLKDILFDYNSIRLILQESLSLKGILFVL